MKTISTQDLNTKLRAGPLALFDVRGDVEYELSHIPGARTAPLGSLGFRIASVMKPSSAVIVYSDNPEDSLAQEAANRLENLRHLNVYCYEKGYDGWVAAGLPVVPSPFPKVQARGPVIECRSLIVDKERAYGGAFSMAPTDEESAGG